MQPHMEGVCACSRPETTLPMSIRVLRALCVCVCAVLRAIITLAKCHLLEWNGR